MKFECFVADPLSHPCYMDYLPRIQGCGLDCGCAETNINFK